MTWQAFPPGCKAAEAWLAFIDDDETTYFLWEGAVRSSKTFGSIMAFVDWVENQAPRGPIGMFGRTRESLHQNVLDPLCELLSPRQADVNRGTGVLTLFGRKVYLFGAPNIDSVTKVQGKGFVGLYCDEATTYPRELWDMLGTRSAADGVKILATMNPASNRHWMKVDYLDRLSEVDGRSWHFTLDDNPFLSERVKARLKKQYTGLWRKRFVEGLWVASEGRVYSAWDEEINVYNRAPGTWQSVVVGIDYGTTNPTCFLMAGLHAGKWYVFKEYYYDSRVTGVRKSDPDYARDLLTFIGNYYPDSIFVDPSAASFIVTLRQLAQSEGSHLGRIIGADNAVVDGIRTTDAALVGGRVMVHEGCSHLIEEMGEYGWDPQATERGEDAPLKADDHGPDALRYLVMGVIGRFI